MRANALRFSPPPRFASRVPPNAGGKYAFPWIRSIGFAVIFCPVGAFLKIAAWRRKAQPEEGREERISNLTCPTKGDHKSQISQNCGHRGRSPRRDVVGDRQEVKARIVLTDGDWEALRWERFEHPHPRVQWRMDVLWYICLGVTYARAAELGSVFPALRGGLSRTRDRGTETVRLEARRADGRDSGAGQEMTLAKCHCRTVCIWMLRHLSDFGIEENFNHKL